MICPHCGVHDADTGAGVHIRIHGGFDAYEIQELLLTGVEPFRPEPEGPDCFCTECGYTAATREDYDRDIFDKLCDVTGLDPELVLDDKGDVK